MSLQQRSSTEKGLFIGLAPLLAVIYIGCLIHLGYLYARMLPSHFKRTLMDRPSSVTRPNHHL
jgi:uncharacterized membrane protein